MFPMVTSIASIGDALMQLPRKRLGNITGKNCHLKVVPGGYQRYFFRVKVKTVKLIGGTRFLAARSGLNVRTYSKSVQMTLRLLYMPAQIIQTMAFTQIMVMWTPWTTPQDHLKDLHLINGSEHRGSSNPSCSFDLNYATPVGTGPFKHIYLLKADRPHPRDYSTHRQTPRTDNDSSLLKHT